MALYEEAKMMRSPMLFFVTNMKVRESNPKAIWRMCLLQMNTII